MLARERDALLLGKFFGSSYHPPAVRRLLLASRSTSGIGLLQTEKSKGGGGGMFPCLKNQHQYFHPFSFKIEYLFFAPILSQAFEIFCLHNSSSK